MICDLRWHGSVYGGVLWRGAGRSQEHTRYGLVMDWFVKAVVVRYLSANALKRYPLTLKATAAEES